MSTALETSPSVTSEAQEPALSGHLKSRHLSMIALGGVIGAGLFVGSGSAIAAAGPGVLLSYLFAGLLVMLIMRMLGEMSAAMPASGSFSVYAERAFGRWAGFTTGWMYWCMVGMGIALEGLAAGQILNSWMPFFDVWIWVLICVLLVTLANFASVGVFGEAEFWLAGVKVLAICLFLVLGTLAIFGLMPGNDAVGLTNLTGHGGFLPHGMDGVTIGFLAAVVSFSGLEVVTVAAAESKDPANGVKKAVRSTVWRVSIFFLGSMAVIVTLLPWDDPRITEGSYVAALNQMGIPGAGEIMNVVVLLALLSAMNANLYNISRIVYSLARRGEAPSFLDRLSKHQVPYRAVFLSALFGFGTVILSIVWPDTLFQFMLNAAGATGLVIWGLIAASQLKLRRGLERDNPDRLVVKMWAFPYLSWVALGGIILVLLLMFKDVTMRPQVLCASALTVLVVGWSLLRGRRSHEPVEDKPKVDA